MLRGWFGLTQVKNEEPAEERVLRDPTCDPDNIIPRHEVANVHPSEHEEESNGCSCRELIVLHLLEFQERSWRRYAGSA
ncbi:hypothetical protein F2Q70_00001692 [Brassica cretica]|uniref:Uncharacterized protein n=1 Tax=Brassica cretica TaxID=69181 RepID=A0A8S9IPD6_BRACR|nr:hypothetical protein F2Q70_00001692 [Brassica cretica]